MSNPQNNPNVGQSQGMPPAQNPANFNPANFNPIQTFQQALHTARKRYAVIGWACVAMLTIWLALNIIISALLTALLYQQGSMPTWVMLLISGLPLYAVAMPIAVLLMRAAPTLPTREFPMSGGRFFTIFLMCLPIMYVGNIIGQVVAALLFGSNATNAIVDLAMNPDWATALYMVVLGPVMEEWLFRKQLISRMRRYGEKLAIVMSSLIFALYHMNLFQFFYAFGLGMMLGYVYMRTSRLRYSIVLHMLINFNGAVLAPWVLSQLDSSLVDALANGDVAAAEAAMTSSAPGLMIMMTYFTLYFAAMIAGVVLLIAKRKSFEFYETPEELPRGLRGNVAFGNAGIVVYIIIALLITLLTQATI